MTSQRKLGIAQILLSGICFGFLGVFGKVAFARGIEPFELLSFRYLSGGLILVAVFLLKKPSRLKLPFKDILVCLGLGLFGYAVFSSFYFLALKGLSAALAVLLLYTYPVMVSVGAWILFGEKIAKDRWIALPLVMLGLLLLIWGDVQVLNPIALLFGLGSALLYSAYILGSSRWLKNIDPMTSVTYTQLGAGAGLFVAAWMSPARMGEIIQQNWLLILAMALVCSVAAMALFLAGLQKLKNWEVSVLSTAEPVTNIALAMVFLGERLTITQSAGALAVFAAFFIVARK